jgi:hypothetical protein
MGISLNDAAVCLCHIIWGRTQTLGVLFRSRVVAGADFAGMTYTVRRRLHDMITQWLQVLSILALFRSA